MVPSKMPPMQRLNKTSPVNSALSFAKYHKMCPIVCPSALMICAGVSPKLKVSPSFIPISIPGMRAASAACPTMRAWNRDLSSRLLSVWSKWWCVFRMYSGCIFCWRQVSIMGADSEGSIIALMPLC